MHSGYTHRLLIFSIIRLVLPLMRRERYYTQYTALLQLQDDFKFLYPENYNKLYECLPIIKTKIIEYGKENTISFS